MEDWKTKVEFIKGMRNSDAPIDFEQSEKDWARELRQSSSEYFRDARIRYGVSLCAGNEFLGIITLNGKSINDDFSLEDFDLLKTITDQAAGIILNINMSERLSQAKE